MKRMKKLMLILLCVACLAGCEKKEPKSTVTLYYRDNGEVFASANNGSWIFFDEKDACANSITYDTDSVFQVDVTTEILQLRKEMSNLRNELELYITSVKTPKEIEKARKDAKEISKRLGFEQRKD